MDIRQKFRNREGYLYTLSIILLMVPLILLIIFYTGVSKSKIEDTSGQIRCDELYYFVEDVEHDLERAMLIFGRRAAIYAISDVVTNNRTMSNYTYTNCSDFVFEGNGSEAAIAELIMCGTLHGENVSYMVNHTLPVWMDRIDSNAEEMHYNVNMTVLDFEVVPYDAWNFSLIIDVFNQFEDETGLCYYTGTNTTLSSITSIIGLEDPLYPLNTNNRVTKFFNKCDPNIELSNLAGCSTEDWGGGIGSGNIVFYSNIRNDPGLGDYCSQTQDINEKILVFDMAFGSCQGLEYDCFDINSSNRLGGVIDYAKNNPDSSFIDKCNVSIPWISATGKIDNETQQGQGHQRDYECADGNLTTGTCVMIKNIPDCDIHQVIIGYSSDNINTSCYIISNTTEYWTGCPSEHHPNGPSFFDRLDGRHNLSEKYVNQSLRHFGNEDIGIETLVSLRNLAEHAVSPDVNATWVDYLYWDGVAGCTVSGICGGGSYDFKLDCPHAYKYSLDTDCVNASGVEPVADISEPANETLYEACPSVMINGTADDCDGSPSSVEVSINGVWYNTTLDGLLWNYTLATDETNKYLVRARATDDDGIIGPSSEDHVIFITGCASGDNTPPGAPPLLSPADGETGVSRTPTFYWESVSDASGIYRYELELNQTSPASSDSYYSYGTEYDITSDLSNNKDHTWRVRAQDNAGNWGAWSGIWTFRT
jgi:hypothetical protein